MSAVESKRHEKLLPNSKQSGRQSTLMNRDTKIKKLSIRICWPRTISNREPNRYKYGNKETKMNPQRNRERMRPRNSWRRSTLREAGRSWSELRYLAENRDKWKKLVDDLCS
jgi:hypothetical protein